MNGNNFAAIDFLVADNRSFGILQFHGFLLRHIGYTIGVGVGIGIGIELMCFDPDTNTEPDPEEYNGIVSGIVHPVSCICFWEKSGK
jgi:hypothetical protein